MMIGSVLLKSYALVFWPLHRPTALACWLASLLLDLLWLRGRARAFSLSARGGITDLVLANVGALVAGLALRAMFIEATLRWKSGLVPAAKAAEWLFALLNFPTGACRGRLYAGTMIGPTSYPVNLDTLGLLLPLLVCGIGCVYLLLCAPRGREAARGLVWLVVVMLAAALVRWVFATGLFLAIGDFVNYESEDLPITPFFKPGFIAVLYLPFLAVAALLLHRPLRECTAPDASAPPPGRRRTWWAWALLAVLLVVVFWEPKGSPKNGTVLINTYHADWSRTDRPYDREWYGAASGYNYACLKRLFEGFFDVRELAERIAAEDLATASVLIIFDPNRRFSMEEVRAIRSFVDRGGGLFLIGDHTNVFGSSSHLNQVAQGLGFRFRDDVLFDLEEDFFQLYDVTPLPSGLLHGMTFFKFRGPASMQATSLFTRNLFTLGNAKSLRAIYSVNNFYPPPHDHPKMWTGDFAVSLASRHGGGRVAGFADSTVFSNFEIFYPGKYEFLLNVVNWLNHVDPPMTLPIKRVSLLGAIGLFGLLLLRAGHPRRLLGTLTATGLLTIGTWFAARSVEIARADFPEPARPMRFLFFAAEPEDEALTLRAFVTDTAYEQKFDVFIQWVLRTDVFSGFHLYGPRFDNALAGMLRDSDLVDTGLALIASRPEHLDLLASLGPGPVAEAGRLLLMFSSELPWEDVRTALADVLPAGDAMAQVEAAWPEGTVRLEAGTRRIAVVFPAERFSDREMGFSEKIAPNDAQRARYAEQFELIDWLFDVPPRMVEEVAAPVTEAEE